MFLQDSGPVSVPAINERFSVHKTTIYRELEMLVQRGKLSEIDFGDGTKRFEIASKGHHHHLVCERCDSVAEIDLHDDFSDQEQNIFEKLGFTITRHNLELFGVCKSCTL